MSNLKELSIFFGNTYVFVCNYDIFPVRRAYICLSDFRLYYCCCYEVCGYDDRDLLSTIYPPVKPWRSPEGEMLVKLL
jgi:hypothetical protein